MIWLLETMLASIGRNILDNQTQKVDQLNHLETQAEEASQYISDMAHDQYTVEESDNRYYHTPLHPSGQSPAAGIDAAKVDGYTRAQILAGIGPRRSHRHVWGRNHTRRLLRM